MDPFVGHPNRGGAAGFWAPVASVLLLIVHTFIPFPAEFLIAVNGAVFGFWGGLAASWVGAMGSACLAFELGRMWHPVRATPGALRRMFHRVERIAGREDWTVIWVIRFIPLLPFALCNFALGRARVSWRTFLWTTAIGVLPFNIPVVAVGYSTVGARQLLPWALGAFAGLTTLGMVLRYRIARAS